MIFAFILFFVGLFAIGAVCAIQSAKDDRIDIEKFLDECRNNY